MESKFTKCLILGMVFTGYTSMPMAQNTGKAAYICDALRPAAVQLRTDAD